MSKVYCADVSCKYQNDKGVCTAKKICLAWASVMTMNDGRREFNRCKTYEESDLSKRAAEFFEAHSKGDKKNE